MFSLRFESGDFLCRVRKAHVHLWVRTAMEFYNPTLLSFREGIEMKPMTFFAAVLLCLSALADAPPAGGSLEKELILHWDFNEETEELGIVRDKSAEAFSHGRLAGARSEKPSFVSVGADRGLAFDATKRHRVDVVDAKEFNHGFPDGLTVEARIVFQRPPKRTT